MRTRFYEERFPGSSLSRVHWWTDLASLV